MTVGGILAPNFHLGMQAALGGIAASLCPQTKGFLELLSECGVDSGEELISTGRGLPGRANVVPSLEPLMGLPVHHFLNTSNPKWEIGPLFLTVS